MAVKVRCPKCSKVLNAPDAARGKAVKCPGCEAKVPVPDDDDDAAPARAAAKPAVKAKAKKTASDADFLSSLNLDGVEDEKIRICPKCGSRLSEEDDECPECGVDTRTGQLTARERRRRSRGGPDTSRFWKDAWSVPWDFLLSYWGLPVKLSLMLALFTTIVVFSIVVAVKYCDLINSPPPAAFWIFVASFFGIGIPGILITILQQIVLYSMEHRDKEYEPKFDMFAALANGVKIMAWIVVMPLPFLPIGIGFLLPGLTFPIAIVHMTRPYVHPAWTAWDMLRIFIKNIGPCLYMSLINFALTLPAIGLLVAVIFLQSQLMPTITGWVDYAANTVVGWTGGGRPGDFMFEAMFMVSLSLIAMLIAIPYWLLFCFPAVFMMRAYGEFGYYFKNNLELINKIPKHQLAGFWPRYLGYMIDILLVNVMGAVIGAVGLFAGIAYAWATGTPPDQFQGSAIQLSVQGLTSLMALLASGFYFAGGESSASQGTLGQRSIGLIVIDEKGRRITFGKALLRFIMRIVTGFTFGLGYLMCAFNEKKQTLHDLTTKTLVVFEGD